MENDKLYINCSEIPIYNFFQVVKTSDLSYILRDKKDLKDFTQEKLYSVLTSILMEYNELTRNTDLMKEYIAQIDIEYMEARYNITKKLISLYLETKNIDIIIVLKDWRWSIDVVKPIEPQLKSITKILIGMKNKINIAKINFVKKFKKEQKKSNPNFDLEKQIINLEISIPLSYKIDVHTDSIKRFIYWNKAIEDRNKAIENGKIKS